MHGRLLFSFSFSFSSSYYDKQVSRGTRYGCKHARALKTSCFEKTAKASTFPVVYTHPPYAAYGSTSRILHSAESLNLLHPTRGLTLPATGREIVAAATKAALTLQGSLTSSSGEPGEVVQDGKDAGRVGVDTGGRGGATAPAAVLPPEAGAFSCIVRSMRLLSASLDLILREEALTLLRYSHGPLSLSFCC